MDEVSDLGLVVTGIAEPNEALIGVYLDPDHYTIARARYRVYTCDLHLIRTSSSLTCVSRSIQFSPSTFSYVISSVELRGGLPCAFGSKIGSNVCASLGWKSLQPPNEALAISPANA